MGTKGKASKWKIAAIVELCVLAVAILVFALGISRMGKSALETSVSGEDYLTLWNDTAEAKTKLIEYIEAITREDSPDYIPPEHRIATFDMDGTLFCETDPIYYEWDMYAYRVLDDPEYRDLATAEQIDVAKRIRATKAGSIPDGLEEMEAQVHAAAYAGMTIEEFEQYVQDYLAQPAPGYEGMTRGEAFYAPMRQILDYLRANGFTVYICSGTERLSVRAAACKALGIPSNYVIGTDSTLVAEEQGDEDGMEYVFKPDDQMIVGGDLIVKNIKMNKVSVISQEIGRRPVLSFGNSTGDASMAEFVVSGNPYRSMAIMLCCDDLERENGNIEKAEQMRELCAKHGWIPVSMKNDWVTIYGDGVTKKQ